MTPMDNIHSHLKTLKLSRMEKALDEIFEIGRAHV